MSYEKSKRYKTPSCAGLTRASTFVRLKFRREKRVDGRVKHGHDDL